MFERKSCIDVPVIEQSWVYTTNLTMGIWRNEIKRERSIFSNSEIFLHSLMDAYFFLSCYYHRDLSASTDPMHKAMTANILLERY